MSDFKIEKFKSFTEFVRSKKQNENEEKKSLTQKKYAEYFLHLLQRYNISNISELSDQDLDKFLGDMKRWELRQNEISNEGFKNFQDFNINEKMIQNDEEFKEYAKNLLKMAHGDNYDDEKANKVINGLLKDKKDDDYGPIIGKLKKSLGR